MLEMPRIRADTQMEEDLARGFAPYPCRRTDRGGCTTAPRLGCTTAARLGSCQAARQLPGCTTDSLICSVYGKALRHAAWVEDAVHAFKSFTRTKLNQRT